MTPERTFAVLRTGGWGLLAAALEWKRGQFMSASPLIDFDRELGSLGSRLLDAGFREHGPEADNWEFEAEFPHAHRTSL